MNRHALHWTCWQPTPYNDLLFSSLAQLPEVRLLVHFREPQVPTHPWRSTLGQGYDSRFFRTAAGIDWTLVKLAARERNATFVFGGWDTPTALVALLLLMARRMPYLVWTDSPDTTAHRGMLKGALRGWWLRRVFARAAAVMGTGAPALAALAEMGCSAEKLRNLPYFVDLDAVVPHLDSAPPPVRYLSSGRLHADKGYDLALRALAAVHGASGGFEYTIAGTGPERDALERLAAHLGIANCVAFRGWLEPDALAQLYRAGVIFLHPARREPYGVAVLEAMAAGLAVIASDATAAALDRIDDGRNGFIHRSGDVDALAAALRRATADRAVLASVRAEARATAERWPVSRGVTLLREVLSGLPCEC
jgi:glycosyltransferase involved in cell wall biosynthesis